MPERSKQIQDASNWHDDGGVLARQECLCMQKTESQSTAQSTCLEDLKCLKVARQADDSNDLNPGPDGHFKSANYQWMQITTCTSRLEWIPPKLGNNCQAGGVHSLNQEQLSSLHRLQQSPCIPSGHIGLLSGMHAWSMLCCKTMRRAFSPAHQAQDVKSAKQTRRTTVTMECNNSGCPTFFMANSAHSWPLASSTRGHRMSKAPNRVVGPL